MGRKRETYQKNVEGTLGSWHIAMHWNTPIIMRTMDNVSHFYFWWTDIKPRWNIQKIFVQNPVSFLVRHTRPQGEPLFPCPTIFCTPISLLRLPQPLFDHTAESKDGDRTMIVFVYEVNPLAPSKNILSHWKKCVWTCPIKHLQMSHLIW